MSDNIYNLIDKEYSPSELLKEVSADHYTLYIVIDNDNVSDKEYVLKSLSEANKAVGTDFVVCCYILKSNDYKKCVEIINKKPTINETEIELNKPLYSFTATATNGKTKVTSEKEYDER